MSDTIELFSALFYVGLAIAVIGLVGAVLLFFVGDIPKVFAQITGRGGKAMAEKIRKQYDTANSKDTDILRTEEILYTEEFVAEPEQETEQATGLLSGGLSDTEGTSVLSTDPTPAPAPAPSPAPAPEMPESQATEVLSRPADETVVTSAGKFEIFESIIWTHTDEII